MQFHENDVVYKVVHEYRAWQHYDKILNETPDLSDAVTAFVKQHVKDNKIVGLDFPEVVLIIEDKNGVRLGRYASRLRKETSTNVKAWVRETLSGLSNISNDKCEEGLLVFNTLSILIMAKSIPVTGLMHTMKIRSGKSEKTIKNLISSMEKAGLLTRNNAGDKVGITDKGEATLNGSALANNSLVCLAVLNTLTFSKTGVKPVNEVVSVLTDGLVISYGVAMEGITRLAMSGIISEREQRTVVVSPVGRQILAALSLGQL